jgi:hypothetical protein
MQQGSVEQAIELAKVRWAAIWPFDLDSATWETLLQEHRPTDVLEAIKGTRNTRGKEPSEVFRSLLYWLGRLEKERAEKANLTWPPSDIQRT